MVAGRIAVARCIGARGHRLRLQSFQREAIVHFIGHHAQQVLLHADVQHRTDFLPIQRQHQISRQQVEAIIQAQAVFTAIHRMPNKHHALARTVCHTFIRKPQRVTPDIYVQPGAALEGQMIIHQIAAIDTHAQRTGFPGFAEQHAHNPFAAGRIHSPRSRPQTYAQQYGAGKCCCARVKVSFDFSRFAHCLACVQWRRRASSWHIARKHQKNQLLSGPIEHAHGCAQGARPAWF